MTKIYEAQNTTKDLLDAFLHFINQNENKDIIEEALSGDETAAEMLINEYQTEISNKNFKKQNVDLKQRDENFFNKFIANFNNKEAREIWEN